MVQTRSGASGPAGARENALVTGGAGFLGAHLVAQLVDSGRYNVTIFDIRDPGNAKAPVVVGDLRNYESVKAAIKVGSSRMYGCWVAHQTSCGCEVCVVFNNRNTVRRGVCWLPNGVLCREWMWCSIVLLPLLPARTAST
jgi:NAD(P)-dependent dehydrogenase (short-subunit alcohol dehydrogenase family)